MAAQKYRGRAQALPNLDESTSRRTRRRTSEFKDRPLIDNAGRLRPCARRGRSQPACLAVPLR
jgi:hypothetical protein